MLFLAFFLVGCFALRGTRGRVVGDLAELLITSRSSSSMSLSLSWSVSDAESDFSSL